MESSTIDGQSGRARVGSTLPSTAVVRAVAAAESVDETELPPLFHAIDPDALDALFESGRREPTAVRSTGSVTFRYDGYEVSVAADGTVDVEPQE